MRQPSYIPGILRIYTHTNTFRTGKVTWRSQNYVNYGNFFPFLRWMYV